MTEEIAAMQISAPAKINLSLRVVRQRDDGFHEIESLIAPITLCDSLEIEHAPRFEFVCGDPALSTGDDNLVVRAAKMFFAETKLPANVRIRLEKRIPHGAGLGGGSSDAAATLRALNQMFETNLSREKLCELAATIGSDVPFFVSLHVAICRGRGEIIDHVALPRRLNLVLFKPEFSVATAWAYSRWSDAHKISSANYERQEMSHLLFFNDLERPVFEKFVFLAQLKSWLLRQPQVAVALLSGSGSTVFVVLRDDVVADDLISRARRELDSRLWAWQGSVIHQNAQASSPAHTRDSISR